MELKTKYTGPNPGKTELFAKKDTKAWDRVVEELNKTKKSGEPVIGNIYDNIDQVSNKEETINLDEDLRDLIIEFPNDEPIHLYNVGVHYLGKVIKVRIDFLPQSDKIELLLGVDEKVVDTVEINTNIHSITLAISSFIKDAKKKILNEYKDELLNNLRVL